MINDELYASVIEARTQVVARALAANADRLAKVAERSIQRELVQLNVSRAKTAIGLLKRLF